MIDDDNNKADHGTQADDPVPPYPVRGTPTLGTFRVGKDRAMGGVPVYPGSVPQAVTTFFASKDQPNPSHIEGFASEDVLSEIAKTLANQEGDFVKESASARPVHARRQTGPRETTVSVLRDPAQVANELDPYVRKLAQDARVSIEALKFEVLALTRGTTIRLDLAEEPADKETLLFVTAFDVNKGVGAMLRSLQSDEGYVAIPLRPGRAVLVPAARPTDITDVTAEGDEFAQRLFVVVALVRLRPHA